MIARELRVLSRGHANRVLADRNSGECSIVCVRDLVPVQVLGQQIWMVEAAPIRRTAVTNLQLDCLLRTLAGCQQPGGLRGTCVWLLTSQS